MLTGLRKALRALLPKDVPQATVVAGRVIGGDSSQPTVPATHNAKGVTCTRSSEGVYVLTLPGSGPCTILSCHIQIRSLDRDLVCTTVVSESARTVTLRIVDTDESAGSSAIDDIETDEGFDYIAVMRG